jgi:integrase
MVATMNQNGLKIEDLKDPGAVKLPRSGTRVFTSRQVRGLQLVMKPNGRREWHYRFQRPGGKRTTLKLGDFPMMSVTDALVAAAREREAVRRGVDVVRERRLEQANAARVAAAAASLVEPRWRFGTLAAEYLTAHEPVLRPSTLARIRSLVRLYIVGGPPAGWDVRAIPTQEYDAMILGMEKVAVASVLHRTCRAMLGWAVDAGRIPYNPLAGRRSLTRRLKVQPRTEVLSALDLHAMLNDGPTRYGDVWPALWLQLLTGMRLGEVTGLRWEWIDMRARVANLPGAVTKSGLNAEVVLSDAARQVLLQQRKARPKSATVFEFDRDALLKRLRRARGLTRTHTIRRTVSTTLQTLGAPEEVRRAILHHASAQGIGKHYDHSKIRAAQFQWLTRLADHWAKVKLDAAAHSNDDILAPSDDPLAAEFEALR